MTSPADRRPVVAYCPPGRQLATALLLMLAGETVVRVEETPHLASTGAVIVTPADTTMPPLTAKWTWLTANCPAHAATTGHPGHTIVIFTARITWQPRHGRRYGPLRASNIRPRPRRPRRPG